MKDPQLPGFNTAGRKASDNARGSRGAGHKWRCHQCGAIQQYWVRAERHADENGHHRIEVLFG